MRLCTFVFCLITSGKSGRHRLKGARAEAARDCFQADRGVRQINQLIYRRAFLSIPDSRPLLFESSQLLRS